MKNPSAINFVYRTPKNSSKQDYRKYFGSLIAHFYPYARNALSEGLKLHGFQSGESVLVPSFICKDLLAVFHELKLKIIFFELDQNLHPILPEKSKAKGILVVNYFGISLSFDIYKKYCETHQLILIEDNAHGFLSQDEQGNYLGTRGDLGIYSLRKTFMLPTGAALVTQKTDPPFTPVVLPIPKSFQFKKIISYLPAKFIFVLIKLTRIYRKIRFGEAIITSLPESEFKTPDYNSRFDFLPLLEKADFDQEKKKRIELYHWCEKNLGEFKITPLLPALPKNAVPYSYVFRTTPETSNKINEFLGHYSLETFPWPDLPQEIINSAPTHYKNIYCVRFIW